MDITSNTGKMEVPSTATGTATDNPSLREKKQSKKIMKIPKHKTNLKINTTTTTTTSTTLPIPEIPNIYSNEEYTSNSSRDAYMLLNSTSSYDSTQSAPATTTTTTTTTTAGHLLQRKRSHSFNNGSDHHHKMMMKTKIHPERTDSDGTKTTTTTATTTSSSSVSSSTASSSLYTPKTIFNSVKLRRLEELKRYQQSKLNYDHHRHQEHFLTPTNHYKSPIQQQQHSPSSSSSVLYSPMSNSNNSSSPSSPLMYHSPRNDFYPSQQFFEHNAVTPTITNTSNTNRNTKNTTTTTTNTTNATTTWEKTRPVQLEERLMTFIDKSPLKISFLIISLIGLIYLMLGYDVTTATATNIYENQWRQYTQILFQTISHYTFEIFITNMKMFVFVLLYGITLDLILISALDTIDIPLIDMRHNHHHYSGVVGSSSGIEQHENREEEDGEGGMFGKRLFQKEDGGGGEDNHDHGDSNPDESRNETKQEHSPLHSPPQQHHHQQKQQQHTTKTTQETKNPVLRQYAIENIRKATAGIALFIVACGLVKGVVYKTMSMILYAVQYVNTILGGILDFFRIEFEFATLSTPSSSTTISEAASEIASYFLLCPKHTLEFIVKILERMMTLPFQTIHYIVSCIFYYTGMSWMWNKFISSVIASSSESICYQSLVFIQQLMMHIGIFLLVFYLVLVHFYPETKKNVGDGAGSIGSSKRTTGVKAVGGDDSGIGAGKVKVD